MVEGVNGFVTSPDPHAIAEAVATLEADKRRAARMGDAGYDLAREITWSTVIDRLTASDPGLTPA